MSDFYNDLKREIQRYMCKYPNKEKKVALRLAFYNFKQYFKVKNSTQKSSCSSDLWIKVEDRKHIDITDKYEQTIKSYRVPKIPFGGYIKFDVAQALKQNPDFKRIGLVVFNGIGDYFLCTAFIEDLKKQLKDVPIDAYVAHNRVNNNTPVIKELLEVNPNIEHVYTFNGHSVDYYKNFDFSELYNTVNNDVLIIPLVYDFEPSVKSRHINLCENYNLKRPLIASKPIIYTDYEFSEAGRALFEKIKTKYETNNYKGIIWLQLNSTCFRYHYIYDNALISSLTENGYLVVCVDSNNTVNNSCITIDTTQIDIKDSIKLLAELNKLYPVFCTGVISCFCAISSGLNIPNLVMQMCYDGQIESVTHPNIYLVTNEEYSCLPSSRQFIPSEDDYIKTNHFFNYKPEFIIKCFNYMLEDIK